MQAGARLVSQPPTPTGRAEASDEGQLISGRFGSTVNVGTAFTAGELRASGVCSPLGELRGRLLAIQAMAVAQDSTAPLSECPDQSEAVQGQERAASGPSDVSSIEPERSLRRLSQRPSHQLFEGDLNYAGSRHAERAGRTH